MNRYRVVFPILLALFVASLYGAWTVWPTAKRTHAPVSVRREALTDFTLTDQFGKPFQSKSMDGNIAVVSFFFASCPGSCQTLNQNLAAIQQEHPDWKTQFVSITCDPDADTPEVLDTYAKFFKADPKRWIFLTGELETIGRIGTDMYQVSVKHKTHTDRATVVDQQGKPRGSFDVTDSVERAKLVDLVARLEATSAEPSDAANPAGPSETL